MAALVVLLAVIAVYLQSLGGPFLWDDRVLIVDAPLASRTGSLGEFLGAPFWSGGTHGTNASYYRPLVSLSFALDSRVHGWNSGGFHLTNVALHAANALVLYFLVRRHGTRAPAAALVSIIWALLPRLAEAAAWISGRTDLIAAFFTLSALLVFGPTPARRIVSALLVGLGLLAKESAVAGILAVAAGTFVGAGALGTRKRIQHTLVALAPFAIVLAAYAVLRARAVGFETTGDSLGALGRTRAVFEALGTYAAMLLDPFRPRAVIGRASAPTVAGLAAGIAVCVLSVALLRLRSRLTVASATGLALFVGALVPVLHVVPLPLRTLAADRFLYLPAAGLALALAPTVERFVGTSRPRWLLAVAFAGSLAVVTFQRVGVWSDEVEFWVQTYRETPKTNSAAVTELSALYYRAGLFEDALALAERAERYDDPRGADAAYNAAICLARLGRHDEARARLLSLRGKERKKNDVEFQLALVEMRAGRFDLARTLLLPIAGTSGDARRVLEALPALAQARRELDRSDAATPAPLRARAAMVLDDRRALGAWSEVIAMPNVPRPLATQGLEYLVQHGDRNTLARAAEVFQARFGSIEPELASMIAMHLDELDRLIAARSRLDLPSREIAKEIAGPAL